MSTFVLAGNPLAWSAKRRCGGVAGGAVALSGPAHADQYDFISALDSAGGELRVDDRHDRYRQGALSRSAERGDATGGARQLHKTGFAPAESDDHPDLGGEQHVF